MSRKELKRWEERLEEFLEELTAGMGRSERRYWAGIYVRGLLLDGQRKSVEPLAVRVLGAVPRGAQVQGLQQFVAQSPWAAQEVIERLARRCAADHLALEGQRL
jgi:SRSO17 transposase